MPSNVMFKRHGVQVDLRELDELCCAYLGEPVDPDNYNTGFWFGIAAYASMGRSLQQILDERIQTAAKRPHGESDEYVLHCAKVIGLIHYLIANGYTTDSWLSSR